MSRLLTAILGWRIGDCVVCLGVSICGSLAYQGAKIHPQPCRTGLADDPRPQLLHRLNGLDVLGIAAADLQDSLDSIYGLSSGRSEPQLQQMRKTSTERTLRSGTKLSASQLPFDRAPGLRAQACWHASAKLKLCAPQCRALSLLSHFLQRKRAVRRSTGCN